MNETEAVTRSETATDDSAAVRTEENGKEGQDEGESGNAGCGADALSENTASLADSSGDALDALPSVEACEERGAIRAESINRTEMREGILREMREFSDLYPNVSYREIPEAVLKSELPLVAAYALYEKRCAVEMARAEAENRKNAARSAGGIGFSGEICYTPAEVRRMTAAEVRENYDSILLSMQRWRA